MYANYFEEYQKQLADWQKQFLATWTSAIPSGKPVFEFPDSVKQSIELQEQLVKSYLESQETAAKIALENQKKFWEGYFDLARQSLATATKAA
ncbi:thylakoid-associated protein [Pannus brasiliensis CCIBt3594]|uniref:Thylakoid-associated protein n=1 Tax=Pannus brasiliensis CCIBt3594 TaxID=1427578 RepID=A0AAW9QWN3_9CHRO